MSRKHVYQLEIQQMMFVLSEIKEPLDETSILLEDIAKRQMIEIIFRSAQMANKRGSRYISAEDLVFLIRHNREKVNRLRLFLSWKDVRKNVKDKDPLTFDEGIDDSITEKDIKIKQKMIKFSWDILSQFTSQLDEDDDFDEGEGKAFEEQKSRLKKADDSTKDMTREEYLFYAECRQASFTFKKLKRFREWCEMQKYYENKANSDVVDILGFFAFEIIRSLTETAILIKKEWDEQGIMMDEVVNETSSLFRRLHVDQTPLLPVHIQEAFRRLQRIDETMAFARSAGKNSIRLI